MKTNGFTLIEVLVASLILFIAISSATIVFNGAVKSKQSATAAIGNYVYLPLLTEHIGVEIRRLSGNARTADGEGHLFGTDYTWRAVIESQAPIKGGTTGEGGSSISNNASRRAALWNVNLNVKHDNKEQTYVFNITSWAS
jgi:prepilin-type N-terminal cleavage/methylation domain-containing protein